MNVYKEYWEPESEVPIPKATLERHENELRVDQVLSTL